MDEISDSLEKNKREYSGLSKSHKLLGEKLEKFQKLSNARAKEEETERELDNKISEEIYNYKMGMYY